MEEQMDVAVIAAEVEGPALQELERRVAALEAALGEVRSVAASASGRKTVATVPHDGMGALDGALTGLSPEQRIAVKNQMARSGLL